MARILMSHKICLPLHPYLYLNKLKKPQRIKQEKKKIVQLVSCSIWSFPPLKHLLGPLRQENSFPGDPDLLGEGLFREMDV